MNLLITGIHGFVGTNLIKAFGKNHNIYGLDIVTPKKDEVIKTYTWNELNIDTLKDIDVIIHLAGKAHDTKKQTNAQSYFDINTELTKIIFDYFKLSSVKKFIFFSSIKAAADVVIGDILTENIIPSPKGPYGESKIKAEEYILSTMKNDDNAFKDKEIIILRPCMIHGPGNKGNLNLLFNVVKNHIPWPLGAFNNSRSFTSIGNLCFVLDKLMNMKISSGIYHISDDQPVSTNELITIICNVMGNKARIWSIPKFLIIFVAKIGDILHLPLNSERLTKLTENYVASNSKIKKAIGVTNMPIKAADGLKITIQSFIK